MPYVSKPHLSLIQVRETHGLETHSDFRDIHSHPFPKFPYAFDDPSPEMIRRAKDGIKRVNNMTLAGLIEYLQEMQNNVSHLAIRITFLLFSSALFLHVERLHHEEAKPLRKITCPNELLQQLTTLRSNMARSNQRFDTLSHKKLQVESRITTLERKSLVLMGDNATLKGDKTLL